MGTDVTVPTPVPVAFLVCDQTSVDAATGKITIVGVFSLIRVQRFPAIHAAVSLYVKLIDCDGEYKSSIEFVQVATQGRLLETGGKILSESRHEYTEFVLQIPSLPLPAPGDYEFRLWMNNKFISSVRVTAQPLAQTEEPQ